MATLSTDEVRHIAKLARLTLDDGEVEKFTTELTSVLTYIDRLQSVDTKGVEPLESITGLRNCWREDTVEQDGVPPDSLLECSPLPVVNRQIKTPSAHG